MSFGVGFIQLCFYRAQGTDDLLGALPPVMASETPTKEHSTIFTYTLADSTKIPGLFSQRREGVGTLKRAGPA